MKAEEVTVRIADEYSPELAAGIGRLLPALSARHSGEPVSEDRLRAIIDSPDRDQFVAEVHGRIVGSAVLNLIVGNLDSKAWLEDFVVSDEEAVRGKGVGFRLWNAMKDWCLERDVYLEFTSRPSRTEAHAFYARQGAVIRDTAAFRAEFKD